MDFLTWSKKNLRPSRVDPVIDQLVIFCTHECEDMQSIVCLQTISKEIMAEVPAEGPGFVGIRFCQECNNMLYPKEDKVVNGISAAVLTMIEH